MNDVAIENMDKIVEMYRRKEEFSTIGSSLGMKANTVGILISAFIKMQVITDEDIEERKGMSRQDFLNEIAERNKDIVSDYENFVDIKDIGLKYGIAEETIRTVLRKNGIELNKRTYRNLKFPKNLIFDVFLKNDFEVLEDNENGLAFVMDNLRDYEKDILIDYYKEEMTLKQIAEKKNLSTERIRQIKAKAIRKLRHPINSKYIKFGYEKYIGMLKKKEIEIREEMESRRIIDVKIEELPLSIRAYNCLKRAGIYTVSDVKSKEQLMKLRALGRKTYEEILQKLHDIGYDVPYEEIK